MKYKVGDIIQALLNKEIDAFGHQCNCFNNMGSGIAVKVKEHFPSVWEADQRTVRGDINKLGTFTKAYGIGIYNLYGQYHYGKGKVQTKYKMLGEALQRMKKDLKGSKRVGFPLIGCGLAGGDWTIVSGMIEEIFKGWDVTIYVLNEKDIPTDSTRC